VSVEELNSILWVERGLLAGLEFALETEQWILSTGRIRWLSRATDQIREAIDELRRTEILRAAAADEVAREVGIPEPPSLSDIAAEMAEPWRSILFDQRAALIEARAAIERVSISSIDGLAIFSDRDPVRETWWG
jgi:FlgN protein